MKAAGLPELCKRKSRLSALPVSTAGSGISSRRLLLTHSLSSRAALKDSGRGAGSTCHCRLCRNALLTSAITCESRSCRASSLISCTSARESRHSCLSSGSVLPTRAVAPHIMISGRGHHQRVSCGAGNQHHQAAERGCECETPLGVERRVGT